jgi:hypothetical protein
MTISPPRLRPCFGVASSRRSPERLPAGPVTGVSDPSASATNPPVLPFDAFPQIILAKQGGEFAGTVQVTFDLAEPLLSAAQRWIDRSKRFK